MRAYGRNIGKPWSDYNERGIGRGGKREQRVAYSGRELISYSTCVARYVDVPATRLHPTGRIVLVTARTYSVSTSSHVRNCTSFVTVPCFVVPNIHNDTPAAHVQNFNHLWSKVTAVAANARQNWNPERSWHAGHVDRHWREQLRAAYDHACLYASLCKVPGKRQPLNILLDATESERAVRLARYNDPKEVARRLRIHARYIAKKALGLK